MNYAQLQAEYAELWSRASIKAGMQAPVERVVNNSITHRARYERVQEQTGVPWWLIAALHSLEASQNFSRHLHNGDPLNARTRQVPAGRPRKGNPPFTWEESAIDALTMEGHQLHKVETWPIERVLFEAERYNGWGYRKYHPRTKSPYLWSFTNIYTSGKYIADGVWSDTHVSQQIGVAAILKMLLPKIGIDFSSSQQEPT